MCYLLKRQPGGLISRRRRHEAVRSTMFAALPQPVSQRCVQPAAIGRCNGTLTPNGVQSGANFPAQCPRRQFTSGWARSPPDAAMLTARRRLLCSPGAGAGGVVAKDALGNDVKASEWLKTHKKGDRSLTQGLKVGSSGAALNAYNPRVVHCCIAAL